MKLPTFQKPSQRGRRFAGDASGAGGERGRVRFALKCPGEQAYLQLAGADGRGLTFEPMERRGEVWERTVDLRPGTYRYRYYVSDGRFTSYFSPADACQSGRRIAMSGLDGVLTVVPAAADRPTETSPCNAPVLATLD